jgi:hypothetical protein
MLAYYLAIIIPNLYPPSLSGNDFSSDGHIEFSIGYRLDPNVVAL